MVGRWGKTAYSVEFDLYWTDLLTVDFFQCFDSVGCAARRASAPVTDYVESFWGISHYLELHWKKIQLLTRSTGTVHTSAKACLTSVAIQIRIRDPDCHQNLVICSLFYCHPSLKISCKSNCKFLHEVANKQTNSNDYISSLVEVTN